MFVKNSNNCGYWEVERLTQKRLLYTASSNHVAASGLLSYYSSCSKNDCNIGSPLQKYSHVYSLFTLFTRNKLDALLQTNIMLGRGQTLNYYCQGHHVLKPDSGFLIHPPGVVLPTSSCISPTPGSSQAGARSSSRL